VMLPVRLVLDPPAHRLVDYRGPTVDPTYNAMPPLPPEPPLNHPVVEPPPAPQHHANRQTYRPFAGIRDWWSRTFAPRPPARRTQTAPPRRARTGPQNRQMMTRPATEPTTAPETEPTTTPATEPVPTTLPATVETFPATVPAATQPEQPTPAGNKPNDQ
jgi:hypothetical protein